MGEKSGIIWQISQQTKWLSVRMDIFAMQKQAAMATEPYTDAYGTQIEPINISSPDLIYASLSQEEADLVERLVLGAIAVLLLLIALID